MKSRQQRLQSAQLYVCTDARREQGDFAEFVDAVYRGGADIIQLRDKTLEAAAELEYFGILRDAARRHHALYAANDRADVAAVSGADVLHLGQGDLSLEDAHRVLPDGVLTGLSTHSVEQAELALRSAHEYFCIGPVWPTPTKPGRPAVGIEVVHEVAKLAAATRPERPWFAIGGVNLHTVGELVSVGVRRVAVVRAVGDATDPEAAAAAIKAALPPLS
ncbi:MAG: thiamine phosphate synthase [Microbacteriaceae bacterium]|jgi:thiamine-phosphate pyrophosphorylase|nr:thiamine phosphate synthase [Microbacteriaceae bacterium]MCI1207641.1 thiamine phosphate synthase [Microbacteriaceae bacterium]